MLSVSILVPTLNEAENIDLLLNRIFAVEELQKFDFEVVFSDGASTDSTCDHVRKWQETHPIQFIEADTNRGLSAAVLAASKKAKGEFVVVMDADLSHPPEKIPELLKPLFLGTHDMVIGSRYVKGGETPDWPYSRKACSLLATLPARIFTDVKDPLAGFIAVRRERLASLTREICGFKFGLELLVTGEQPFSVTEVPISFHDRCYGDSKMSLGVIFDYFHQLLILSGISLRHSCSTSLVLLLCLVGVSVDAALLNYLVDHDMSPGWAHWLSFVLASAVTGTATVLVASRRKRFELKLILERTISYWTTVLLVIFLRSGVIYHLAGDGILNFFETVFLAVASVVVCYAGCISYVFSIGRKRIRGEPVKRFYIVGIVVYLFLFRLVSSTVLPLLEEEQFYFDLAQGLGPGDLLSVASFPAVFSSFVFCLGPETLFSFRLGSCAVWFLSAIFVFCLSRDVYSRSVGFRALILFSVLPFFYGTGLHVTKDTILTLFWAASLYWLYRFLALGTVSAWIYASIVLGICLVFEPLSVVLIVAVLIYILTYGGVPGWLRKRKVWSGFGITALVWASLYTLNPASGVLEYGGVSWIDASFGWQVSKSPFAPLLLITPVGVFAGILCCGHTGFDHNQVEDVHQYPLSGRKNICSRTLFLLPVIAGFCLAIFTGNFLLCSTVVWLAALPCIAVSLFTDDVQTGVETVCGKRLKFPWLLMISLLIFAYGMLLHLETLM